MTKLGVGAVLRRALATWVLLGATAAFGQTASHLNALGVERYEAEDFGMAREHFEAALRLEPGNAIIRRNYTNALQAMGGGIVVGGRRNGSGHRRGKRHRLDFHGK